MGAIFLTSHIFAAESSGGIAALGVDLKDLILQIATFVIVFWLLKKFALEKIITTLDERRKTIDQGVKLGQKMAAEKDRLDAEVEKQLQKARLAADKIIADGHHEAGEIAKAAEQAASRKTDAMLADAHARIEDDIKRARKQLEQDVLELVAEATEAVTREKLDTKKDNALIEKFLSEVKS